MASKGINKSIILGRLGQDPEVRKSQDGTAFATLSVATSEEWKDKQGQKQSVTEWHRISIIGKLAEIAGQYLRKGSNCYFEGKIKTRKWQGQDGKDNYTTEIVVDSFNGVMQMLDGPSQNQPQQQSQQQPQQQNQGFQNQGFQGQQQGQGFGTNAQQPNPQNSGAPQPSNEFDDDIPS